MLDGVLVPRLTEPEHAPRLVYRRVLQMAVACLAGVAAAALVAFSLWPEPQMAAVTRTVVPRLEGQEVALGNTSPVVALAPDGSRVVYRTILEDQREALVTRALNSMETTVLYEGVATGFTPTFSPDWA
jgi:hypothetical protein